MQSVIPINRKEENTMKKKLMNIVISMILVTILLGGCGSINKKDSDSENISESSISNVETTSESSQTPIPLTYNRNTVF